jgi:hypothetical protein
MTSNAKNFAVISNILAASTEAQSSVLRRKASGLLQEEASTPCHNDLDVSLEYEPEKSRVMYIRQRLWKILQSSLNRTVYTGNKSKVITPSKIQSYTTARKIIPGERESNNEIVLEDQSQDWVAYQPRPSQVHSDLRSSQYLEDRIFQDHPGSHQENSRQQQYNEADQSQYSQGGHELQVASPRETGVFQGTYKSFSTGHALSSNVHELRSNQSFWEDQQQLLASNTGTVPIDPRILVPGQSQCTVDVVEGVLDHQNESAGNPSSFNQTASFYNKRELVDEGHPQFVYCGVTEEHCKDDADRQSVAYFNNNNNNCIAALGPKPPSSSEYRAGNGNMYEFNVRSNWA